MAYQKQQQQQGASAGAATQPIVSLSPFLGQSWSVRARVTDKQPIKHWSKNDRTGSLFGMTLLDDSGAIRATFFGNDLNTVHDKLVNGSIYVFSRGSVKNANKRFSSVNNDYELNFDEHAFISDALQDTGANDIPTTRYNFSPLDSLPSREKDTRVDALFVVKEVEQPRGITSKASGKDLTKRTVILCDKSAMCELTLWGDEANNCVLQPGQGYILKGAKVGSYLGGASLSVWSLAESLVPIPQDTAMQALFQQAKDAANGLSGELINVSKPDPTQGGAGGNYVPVVRRHFDDVERLQLGGNPEKADFLEVRCIATFIKTESLWYEACSKCNKKVQNTGPGQYQCPNNQCMTSGQAIVMEERYMIAIQASDGVSQTWITMFQEAGKEFFGMSAHELRQEAEKDAGYLNKLSLSLLYKPLVLKLKAKQENRGEEGTKTQLSANKCTRIQGEESFSSEIDKMLEHINLYEGGGDLSTPGKMYN